MCLKPARAAAANLPRKGRSLKKKDRFAARRTIHGGDAVAGAQSRVIANNCGSCVLFFCAQGSVTFTDGTNRIEITPILRLVSFVFE